MVIKDSARPVTRLDSNGSEAYFLTAKEASTKLNLPRNSDSNIIKACNGKRSSAAGYRWRFTEDLYNGQKPGNDASKYYLWTFPQLFAEVYQEIDLEVIRMDALKEAEEQHPKNCRGKQRSYKRSNHRLVPKYEMLPNLLIRNMLADKGVGMTINRGYFCSNICDRTHFSNIVRVWVHLGVIEEPTEPNHDEHQSSYYQLTEKYQKLVELRQIQQSWYDASHSTMIKKLVEYEKFCKQEEVYKLSKRKKRQQFEEHWKKIKEEKKTSKPKQVLRGEIENF